MVNDTTYYLVMGFLIVWCISGFVLGCLIWWRKGYEFFFNNHIDNQEAKEIYRGFSCNDMVRIDRAIETKKDRKRWLKYYHPSLIMVIALFVMSMTVYMIAGPTSVLAFDV